MKNSAPLASAALSLLAGIEAASPAHPGGIALDPKFRTHLKCPYAEKWLAKGPAAAAKELGLDEYGRKLTANEVEARRLQGASSFVDHPVKGSCSFMSPWSGPSCLQFNGAGWTDEGMAARCGQETDSTFNSEGCGDAAGWCDKALEEGRHEVSMMNGDCGQNKMACEAFVGGAFVAGADCMVGNVDQGTNDVGGNIFGGDDAAGAPSMGGPPPGVAAGGGGGSYPGAAAMGGDDAAMKCIIAPGAIGAAHQAGFSKGYSNSCPGVPGQESPYMWPLRWSAEIESHSMAYGSDDVVHHSKGTTYYMLDKNWKRSDTSYAIGTLRAIGQGPCEDETIATGGEGVKTEEFGCFRNQTDGTVTTMIHRGGLMYFIDWKEDEDIAVGETDGSKIAECTKINLAVIGNIRPDWFLDTRGDDTDVQYVGDQHLYYADGQIPKLVKQWRKKDFASQYFVMSMMGNPPNKLVNDDNAPEEDKIHWPLILNIPGEGFGDDSLQVYKNHNLLTDEDEALFTIIESFEAMGGVCAERSAQLGDDGEPGDIGPPSLEEDEKIPSNLEVDPLSWVSNEITFSPIWEIPTKEMSTSDEGTGEAASTGKAVLEVSDRITVESCYDASTNMMDMTVHFHDVEATTDGLLPWMAVGYRPSEKCAMMPSNGGVTPLVLITQDDVSVAPEAHKTMMPKEAKANNPDAFSSMYALMKPLGDLEEYADVMVEAPMVSTEAVSKVARASSSLAAEDTVSLHFKQAVEGEDVPMNLMYAIGMNSQLGVHVTRGCFQVEPTPCGGAESMDVNVVIDLEGNEQEEVDAASVNSSAMGLTPCIAFVFSAAACWFGL